MPRSYQLGRRTAPKADTRARIIAAALAVFRDHGLAGSSTLAVARAADVAPGTVRNHFPEPGALAGAVFDAILQDMRVPTPAIFDGIDALAERVERLAVELAAFYERGREWWRAYEREPELTRSTWNDRIDQHNADIEALMRTALADLSTDERSVAVVASVIGPPTFFALRARGLSSDEAVRLSLELAVPWLEHRRTQLAGRRGTIRRPRTEAR